MTIRWFAAACFAAVVCLAYAFIGTPQSTVTVTDGKAIPVGTAGTMFMVTLNMQNDGPPVTLQSVASASEGEAMLVNPDHNGPAVLPGGDTAQLAMDGAHIMMRVEAGSFLEGTYHSLALVFDNGSEVVARVLRSEETGSASAMDHGLSNGIAASPAPTIELAREPEVSKNGFSVDIVTENFEFVRINDTEDHVDGQGHAHIYLNGVKLGRLYKNRFDIGTLSPGNYVLTVALNSNDHRPYMVDGKAVALNYRFKI